MPLRRCAAVLLLAVASTPASASSVIASWYGEGQMTASGARFNPGALTAAHRTLPFGTRVRVSYRGHSVVVRINDRGPAQWTRRDIDLSRAAAVALGMTHIGVARVGMKRL